MTIECTAIAGASRSKSGVLAGDARRHVGRLRELDEAENKALKLGGQAGKVRLRAIDVERRQILDSAKVLNKSIKKARMA
ncbi:unnamed protein product [marine sediment metagenome]|uniref:Uncharacterized protein n=1 Tax=marine sediment metagenome TaxID=412755 RepID=X0RKC2_9ZZZZ